MREVVQVIAAEGERADLVPLGLIVAGLIVAVLAVLLLMPRHGGRRASRTAAAPGRLASGPAHDPAAMARQLAQELDARADRLERLLAQAQEAISRLEHGVAGTTGSGGLLEGKPPTGATAKSIDGLTTRIYELADSGRTPVEIAKATGQHTGQVELILALRR